MTQLKKLITTWLVSLLLVAGLAFADAQSDASVLIKDSAPNEYIVKKGDTLWAIAGMYLDKPWNWPLLWQKNTQIKNPHLIYPGDKILLINDGSGQPSIQLVRNDKKQITLFPKAERQLKNAEPIPTLPWSVIETHIKNDLMMDKQTYEAQPYLLGDHDGAVRFAHSDMVLGKKGGFSASEFHIVREHTEILDVEGESLGFLVKSIATAVPVVTEMEDEILVRIQSANLEIKPGDRLLPKSQERFQKMVELIPAKNQSGNIISSLQDRALLGKYDTVVIDIGSTEIDPGTIMGIYLQGPDIIDNSPVRYDENSSGISTIFGDDDRIKQPALKVGELVVFKSFEKVSYGLITSSTSVIRKGAVVAKP